jgi:low temperature requirement protein LtrA
VLRATTPVTAEGRVVLADQVGDVHRPVVIALLVSAVSGALLLAADLEALAVNKVLWVKMGLLLLLAGNGLLMLRDERALRRATADGRAFLALRARAFTSLGLWLAITLAGVGLMQG